MYILIAEVRNLPNIQTTCDDIENVFRVPSVRRRTGVVQWCYDVGLKLLKQK